MLRVLRGVRGLQRRLTAVVFASVLVFLLYLLLSNSGHLQSRKDKDLPSIRNEDQHLPQKDDTQRQNIRTTTKTPDLHVKGLDVAVEKHDIVENADRKMAQVDQKADVKHMVQEPKVEQKLPEKTKETAKPDTGLPPLATDLSDPYSGPRNKEQQEITAAFLHAWTHYKKYAWGHDELKPVSKGWGEWMGIGLTIVDSLDTMYIMGLKEEFALGRDWVEKSLNFNTDRDVQLFEITIRELGGLLSAYHLSGDKIFLDKALELGDKLYPCFHGPTKVPCNRINLKRGRPSFIEISTAESGTIQLEFRALSRASKIDKYEKAIEGISDHLHRMKKLDGLVSCFINPHTGDFQSSSTVSVGASADSYYEYLIKQWIQTGKTKDWMRLDYLESVTGMQKHLYRFTGKNHLGFMGAYNNANSRGFRSEMEHLACFLPGTLALGYMAGLEVASHMKMAENLTNTCYQMYAKTPTGLSPEVTGMSMNAGKDDTFIVSSAAYNLQRPETVESIFYMYRATKDQKYRDWGWRIFQAFEKYTRLPEGGYASISNVRSPDHPGYRDKMETFYLAETLKYLYLLFSDDPDLIPLDKFVINTEAHPLPVYNS